VYDIRTARLTVLLDALGCLPGPSFAGHFDERLALQKTVYLLDAAFQKHDLGGLGYQFGWYVRGPYSSTAADDLFAIAAQPDRAALRKGLSLNTRGKRAVGDVAALLQVPQAPAFDSMAHWLELLASLHFLTKRRTDSCDFGEAWERLQATKPKLADAKQAEAGWSALKAQGLC
jgi:hypothetical protein